MKPKYNVRLTKEERELEAAIARGEFTSVPNFAERKKELEAAAGYTLAKTKTISVRITEKNLLKLKAAAAREGLPYQTLITSILHKHV